MRLIIFLTVSLYIQNVYAVNFASWSDETLPKKNFDVNCSPGHAVNGLTLRSTKETAQLSTNINTDTGDKEITDKAKWSDALIRVFCAPLISDTNDNVVSSARQPNGMPAMPQQNVQAPAAPPPPPRPAQMFTLADGMDAEDQEKNCRKDEYVCGLSGTYDAGERMLRFKCCQDSKIKRGDSCRSVGPATLSDVNPNEFKNPSQHKPNAGSKCAGQSVVGFGLKNGAAQMKFCDMKENGKQYDASCGQKGEKDVEDQNRKVEEQRKQQPQASVINQPKAVNGEGSALVDPVPPAPMPPSAPVGVAPSSNNNARRIEDKSGNKRTEESHRGSRTRSESGEITPTPSKSFTVTRRRGHQDDDNTNKPTTIAQSTISDRRRSYQTTGVISRKSTAEWTTRSISNSRKWTTGYVSTNRQSTYSPHNTRKWSTTGDHSDISSTGGTMTSTNGPRHEPAAEYSDCVCVCSQKCRTPNNNNQNNGNQLSKKSSHTDDKQRNDNNGNGNKNGHNGKKLLHENNGRHVGQQQNRNKRSAEQQMQIQETTYNGKKAYMVLAGDQQQKTGTKLCPKSACNCGSICNEN